jgi:hypothetical protein
MLADLQYGEFKSRRLDLKSEQFVAWTWGELFLV